MAAPAAISLLTNLASSTAVILGLVPRICQRIEKSQRLQMPGTGPSMTEERFRTLSAV